MYCQLKFYNYPPIQYGLCKHGCNCKHSHPDWLLLAGGRVVRIIRRPWGLTLPAVTLAKRETRSSKEDSKAQAQHTEKKVNNAVLTTITKGIENTYDSHPPYWNHYDFRHQIRWKSRSLPLTLPWAAIEYLLKHCTNI